MPSITILPKSLNGFSQLLRVSSWAELTKSLLACSLASSPVPSLFSLTPLTIAIPVKPTCQQFLKHPLLFHSSLAWWRFSLKCALSLFVCLVYSPPFKLLSKHPIPTQEACPAPLFPVSTVPWVSNSTSVSDDLCLLYEPGFFKGKKTHLIYEHSESLAVPGIEQTINVGDWMTETMNGWMIGLSQSWVYIYIGSMHPCTMTAFYPLLMI